MSGSADMAGPLPWQEQAWSDWLSQIQQQRVPHAVLLGGAPGLGKRRLAEAFAHALLCTGELSRRPCGSCKACGLLAADSHPDYRLVEPEEAGKAIRIDQVRELVGFLSATAQQGGWKCVILAPADAMNSQAANALLKSLEEPPGDSLILLVSSAPSRLMPTLRSRCRLVHIKVPARDTALQWLGTRLGQDAGVLLDLAYGAPCAALAAAESGGLDLRKTIRNDLLELALGRSGAEECAKRFSDRLALAAIDELLSLLDQLARAPWNPDEEALLGPQWRSLASGLDLRLVFRFRDKLLVSKQQVLSSNPNQLLLWEEIMFDWQALWKSGRVNVTLSR